jgi:hypothetical protein
MSHFLTFFLDKHTGARVMMVANQKVNVDVLFTAN